MAKKPIIEIDVDDDKFKKFYEIFSKFQEDLDKTPDKMGNWEKLLAFGMGALAEDVHKMAGHLAKATHVQSKFGQATQKSSKEMGKMAHASEVMYKSIAGIGRFSSMFLRVGSTLARMGGLGIALGAGAVFGMDRLASDAVNTQRRARSMGLNTGQLRSWNINFGRYAGENTLASIAEQKGTLAGQWALARASGLSVSQVSTASTAELDYRILLNLKRMAKHWNPAAYDAEMQANGFSQLGFSVPDLRVLMAARTSSLKEARQHYLRDAITDRTGRSSVHKLFAFERELSQAGKALGTDLQRRLSALGPSLGGFIHALTSDAEVLINGLLSKGNLKAMQSGIKDFTHFLASGEMKDDLTKFAHAITHLAGMAEKAAHWLGKTASAVGWTHRRLEQSGNAIGGWVFDVTHQKHSAPISDLLGKPIKGGFGGGNQELIGSGIPIKSTGQLLPWWHSSRGNKLDQAIKAKRMARYAGYIVAAEKKYKLPPGLLGAMIMTESGGNPNAVSPAGAEGLLQLMPGTAKELDVKNPFSPLQSIMGGAKYMRERMVLAKRMLPNGSLRQQEALALSMYNAGHGTLNKDIAKARKTYGADWFAHLSSYFVGGQGEARSYAPSVFSNMAFLLHQRQRSPALNVHVSNATSSRVAVSAAAYR